MRTLILLLIVSSFADARLFGQTLSPSAEVPVSDPVVAAAPLEQIPVASDSNGEIALVAWTDNRSGAPEAYAARMGGDEGRVFDPLGIRLGEGIPRSVVWTGTEFMVVLAHPGRHEMVFIDAAGTIEYRSFVDAGEPFIAAIDGDDIRLLFLTVAPTSGDVTYLRGHLVDPLPELPGLQRIELPASPAGYTDVEWIGGSDGTSLLVLRLQRSSAGGPDRVVAERIGRDGDHLSSTVTGPFDFDSGDKLRGNAQGYILVTQTGETDPVVRSYALDPSGAFTGQTDTLPLHSPSPADISLERDGSRYLLAWAPNPFQTRSFSYLTTVAGDATFGLLRVIGEWQGTQSGVTIAAAGDYRVVFQGIHQHFAATSFDVYGTEVNADLSAQTPELVSQSPNIQSGVRVAASQNGYIVTWGENGPDSLARVFVRRFSSTGVPIDPAPVEVFAFSRESNVLRVPQARVAATPNAYIVVWATDAGLFARRMSTAGAGWLDPEPARIAPSVEYFDVASNGTDALAVWTAPCAQSLRCVVTRRLPMSGLLTTGIESIVSDGASNYDVTAGSDGTDYLVAWSEGRRECFITCSLDPFSLLAARVRADGTPIDIVPLRLEDRQTFAEKPVVAFDGQRYVVLWSAWNEGWTVRGARVSRAGEVLETSGGAGTVVDAEIGPASVQPVLARLGQHFVLFHRATVVVNERTEVRWTAVTFPLNFPLAEVAALPRQTFLHHTSQQFASLHAVTGPTGVMYVAYDRVAHEAFGGVARAFVSRFNEESPRGRRRAVSR